MTQHEQSNQDKLRPQEQSRVASEDSNMNQPKAPMGRIDLDALNIGADKHWGIAVAEQVVEAFPNVTEYTCAAGISPSGVVHFGNFRDVMTSLVVARGLEEIGVKSRLLFSWDDFDRFRKVPVGVPDSFRQFIGLPLSDVPDPQGEYASYAKRFEEPFEQAMRELDIEMEWRYQSQEYRSGRYIEQMLHAMRSRGAIADVLLSNMSEKGMTEKGIDPQIFKETYFPLIVYSEFTGKDTTQILDFDGNSEILYRCNETGTISKVDLREKSIAKLSWKIDWPMRWGVEQVCFEPGGRDHASPGGSFDSGGVISDLIFNRRPPAFIGYDFVGLKGLPGKMSGSKGGAMTPSELLEIFEPELLKWFYTRKLPTASFNISFDSEVYRSYDEFDREMSRLGGSEINNFGSFSLKCSRTGELSQQSVNQLSFRQIAAFGQIVQWDTEKLSNLAVGLGMSGDRAEIESRTKRARTWLEKYQPQDIITVRSEVNQQYAQQLNQDSLSRIESLRSFLAEGNHSLEELEEMVYKIPKDPTLTQKENSPKQRAFFAEVYNMLIGKDTGPRLSTFIWAIGEDKVSALLDVRSVVK